MDGYRELVPPPALRPWVATFWTWEGGGGAHRVLPDGCIDVLFSLRRGGTSESSRLEIVGTMTRSLEVIHNDAPLLVGVRFKPGGARAFLGGMPAAELTDQSPALAEVWGEDARILEERLVETTTFADRLRLFESALLDRLRQGGESLRDPLVEAAVMRLEVAGDGVDVPRLSAEVGLGPRQLRRRFLDAVGIPPKRLARILRFQRVLEEVVASGGKDWTDLALDAGYYDQAHMIRDFREWTGLSPSRYLAERNP